MGMKRMGKGGGKGPLIKSPAGDATKKLTRKC